MVNTIKFSQMTNAGDINNNDIMPSLRSGENVILNNPWTFLPSGTTAQRPAPSPVINFRLRYNIEDELYEYYDAIAGNWTQLQETAFTVGPYIIYTADASLPDAQNLGALASGMLKQTISSGSATLGIGVNGTDYYGPGYTGYINAPAGIADINGNPILNTTSVGSLAVNYIGLTNSLTTLAPSISAEGTDTNIGLMILTKGTGAIGLVTGALTQPLSVTNGTAGQHVTDFVFPNTAATRTVTWPDASGTVALDAATTTVYVDAAAGSDSAGSGSALNPYKTVAFALSTITTNSTTNRYVILLKGQTSETAIALKPWVSLVGLTDNTSQITVTGSGNNVTLDPSFLTATSPSISIWNINFAGTTNLLFNLTSGGSTHATIGLQGVICNNFTLTGRGTTFADEVQLYGCDISGTSLVTDGNIFSYVTEYDSTISIVSTNATTTRSWISNGDLMFGTIAVSETSSQNMLAEFNNSNIQTTITGSGSTVQIRFDGMSYPTGGITLTSGASIVPVLIPGYNGGTGVNNGTSTFTMAGNVAFSGAFPFVGTLTASTAVTFPTSGTLATTSQIPTLPLSLSNGGTGANLTASNGGIFYSTGTTGAILAGTATASQILLSGATGAPSWSTTTYPSTNAINTLLYASAANVMSALAAANNATLITGATGVPAMTVLGTSKLLASNASGVIAGRSFTVNTVVLTTGTSYTSSVGTVAYFYELLGGGGGGGSVATTSGTTYAAAAGGGSGEYVTGFSNTPASALSYSIGGAGTGGAAGGNTGNSGGTTTFGTVTALGGNGGGGRLAITGGSIVGGIGGTGGVNGNGTRTAGQAGGAGNCAFNAIITNGGYGGNSIYGAGGNSTVGSAGNNGLGFGAGGSGASAGASQGPFAGGNGTQGVIVIKEIIIN